MLWHLWHQWYQQRIESKIVLRPKIRQCLPDQYSSKVICVRIQAAPCASSEVLSVLQAEEGADSVQVLGDCEGAGSAGKASTEAFKRLQQSTQMPKVVSGASLEVTLCFSASMCVSP